ncbi:MAG: hypothetical protein WA434_12725, partial [Candidatus Acidiferrales bacterium]
RVGLFPQSGKTAGPPFLRQGKKNPALRLNLPPLCGGAFSSNNSIRNRLRFAVTLPSIWGACFAPSPGSSTS